MSDAHHEHDGGHELENLNANALFKIIGSTGLIVSLSVVAVTQFFYEQRDELMFEINGAEPGYTLTTYWAEMDAQKEGLADTVAKVAEEANALRASPAPPGWVHPDDLKQGGAK